MEEEDILQLVDEEGNEVNLQLIVSFEHKGDLYIAVTDADAADTGDNDEVEVRILKVEETDGEDNYVDIEDESLLDELYSVFLDIMEQEEE